MCKYDMMRLGVYWLLLFMLCSLLFSFCKKTHNPTTGSLPFYVIGYFAGPPEKVDSFRIDQLTHVIYSFGHLKGNSLFINSAADTLTIKKMVEWKRRNPGLKVLLSLGGWGGCENCSTVFSTETGRREFAESVKELTRFFQTDGLDLDWEYPAIPGFPGHTYKPEDKDNFTLLCKTLREVNGDDFIISFAAGGFDEFIDSSIAWSEVEPYIDIVNIMTYDLTHGASTAAGHHTPLYSTTSQKQSTDNAVKRLLDIGMPSKKLVIGAAFYGRFFKI